MHFERLEAEPNYKKLGPGSIQEFRGSSPDEKIDVPELSKNRKSTNFPFFIIFSVALLGWIAFAVYVKVNGEIVDLKLLKQKRVYLAFPAVFGYLIVASTLTLILYRFWTRCTIIFLLVLSFLLGVPCSVYHWYFGIVNRDMEHIAVAVACTMIFLILLWVVFLLGKQLPLVVSVTKEAMLAMFSAPVLLLLPILTFSFTFGMWVVTVFFGLYSTKLWYVYLPVTMAVMYWIYYFAAGCQCMIVAGTVAGYYFAKDKAKVAHSFIKSFSITLRYHLGTIAAGSLIITIIATLGNLADAARRRSEGNVGLMMVMCCLTCILSCLEEIAKYFTRKAYIMTAIHGTEFCTSGKRGAQLLWYFLLDTIGVEIFNFLAFVGAVAALFLTAIGIYVGITWSTSDTEINRSRDALLWVVIAASSMLLYFYYTLFSVSVDTIFLCFCEDKLTNDGSSGKPYFMSARLAEVALVLSEMAETEYQKRVMIEQRQRERNNETQNQNQNLS